MQYITSSDTTEDTILHIYCTTILYMIYCPFFDGILVIVHHFVFMRMCVTPEIIHTTYPG